MREYLIRFLSKMKRIKGQEYIDNLLSLGTITQKEYDAINA